jgi:hypothetical protein
MKKNQLFATIVLASAVVGALGATICLAKRSKEKKRLAAISDAGYELAYDLHYPTSYKVK